MNEEAFDDVIRAAATEAGSRRAVMQSVVGCVVGALAARFGLTAAAAAKSKNHGKKRKQEKQKSGVGSRENETLRAQGKGRGNGKKKHKKDRPSPPPLPDGCKHCGYCEMCKNGKCVPDPDLDLVRCLDHASDPGGQCHLCQSGACLPVADGGTCVDGDGCSWCQGGKCVANPQQDLEPCGNDHCHLCNAGVCTQVGNGSSCTDSEGTCCGGVCRKSSCPAGKRFSCDTGECDCGEDSRRCASGGCVGPDDCCPGEWRCRDGACVPRHQCCSNERRCSDGSCVSAGACCASEKLCPDGSCIAANSCCPDSPRPHCKDCQELACQNGEWVCWGECECTLDCDEETGACKTLGCGPNEICMQGKCQAQCTSEFPACVVLRSDGIPYFVGCCWEGSHCSKTWYGMGWCCPDSHERCY